MGVVLSLTGCAPEAATPITQPIEAMEAPWGPFARQCDSTRLSRDTVRWRVRADRGRRGLPDLHRILGDASRPQCGSRSRRASAKSINHRRRWSCASCAGQTALRGRPNPATPGCWRKGRTSPDAAQILADDIGLTARQMIKPNETLALPVRLAVPFPLDVVMSCRPDGERRDRGRDTLGLSLHDGPKGPLRTGLTRNCGWPGSRRSTFRPDPAVQRADRPN